MLLYSGICKVDERARRSLKGQVLQSKLKRINTLSTLKYPPEIGLPQSLNRNFFSQGLDKVKEET